MSILNKQVLSAVIILIIFSSVIIWLIMVNKVNGLGMNVVITIFIAILMLGILNLEGSRLTKIIAYVVVVFIALIGVLFSSLPFQSDSIEAIVSRQTLLVFDLFLPFLGFLGLFKKKSQ